MIKTLYPIFQKWSARGSVYLMGDPHFNDDDCRMMAPDWISAEEQIKIINSIVCKNDTFICLGDVGDPQCAAALNGYKVLILGNHDKKGQYRNVFNEIYDGPLFIADKILLSHEPVYGLPWCLNIHGHDHNGVERYREGCPHLNLVANKCDYTPVSLGKIIKAGALSKIKDIHRMTIDEK